MGTIFSHISINYSEYQYFCTLSKSKQVAYLFDIYEAEQQKHAGLDLSAFFKTVVDNIEKITSDSREAEMDSLSYDYMDSDIERVDVMIDDENIMIETNSLKALRYVTFKFAESGYIMRRDISIEKMFKKDKVTKYLRIFRIIDQSNSLCFN
jgi:hypothetical protein